MPNPYFYEKQLPSNPPLEFQVERMDAGIVLDVSNRDAPLESASDAKAVRFETGGVRKDFGRSLLGAAATSKILAIGEHRYFTGTNIHSRLVRMIREADGSLKVEKWDGAAWTLVGTYPEIADVYLSVVSIQNIFAMADGERILSWEEIPVTSPEHEEFTADEFLSGFDRTTQTVDANPACGTEIVISPAGALGPYIIRVRVIWSPIFNGVTISLPIQLKKNGVLFQEHVIEYTPDEEEPDPVSKIYEISTDDSGETFDDGDTLQICVVPPEEIYISAPMEKSGPEFTAASNWTTPHFSTEKHWVEGDASEENYTFRFDLINHRLFGGVATVGFYHKAGANPWVQVGEVVYDEDIDPPVEGLYEHTIAIANVAMGDLLGIHIESISPAEIPDQEMPGGRDVAFLRGQILGTPQYSTDDLHDLALPDGDTIEEDKYWDDGIGEDRTYRFTFESYVEAGATLTIGYGYNRMDGGVSLVELDEIVIDNTAGGVALDQSHVLDHEIEDTEQILNFYIAVKATSMASDADAIFAGRRYVTQVEGDKTGFTVKPANMAEDSVHGVTYNVPTGAFTDEIELLSEDAPAGRFIFPFGDRLISLRDLNDVQVIASSADGLVRQWAGEDTAYFALLDAASDSLDDLMGAAHLAPGTSALFRKRSIHRVHETGNVEVPIAVVKWIEQLGTESPFSIRLVDRGIAFLGHDKMVYILTEGGPQPVSPWIHDELKEKLADANMELVDSAYNASTGEYFLGIPIGESESIEEVWILDVKKFWLLDGQEQPWRRREMTIGRLAQVSAI